MQHGFENFTATARSGGDLPSILQALQSGHIGTARPSYVEDGMVWHKHRPSEGVAGTIEKYFTFGGVDFLEGSFDLDTGEYSGAGGGGAPTIQVFTASGTWTRPEGCIGIKITITGGGMGGNDGGDGGASASTGISYRDVTALASAAVTIGAGSAGNTGSGFSANGGASTWVGGGTIAAAGGTSAGASVTGADLNIRGASWDNASGIGGTASFWGGGGAGGNTPDAGLAFGSGGGGDPGGGIGASGAPGVCVVEEFY
jgi:hypothetical protein